MDRKDEREWLRRVGFAEAEVNRLFRVRRDYKENKRLQSIADHRRLEFVRWLVAIGKLTDQIA